MKGRETLIEYINQYNVYQKTHSTPSSSFGTQFTTTLYGLVSTTTNEYLMSSDPSRLKWEKCENYKKELKAEDCNWVSLVYKLFNDAVSSQEFNASLSLYSKASLSAYSITLHSLRLDILEKAFQEEKSIAGDQIRLEKKNLQQEKERLQTLIDNIESKGRRVSPTLIDQQKEIIRKLAILGDNLATREAKKLNLFKFLTEVDVSFAPLSFDEGEVAAPAEAINIFTYWELQPNLYKLFSHFLKAGQLPKTKLDAETLINQFGMIEPETKKSTATESFFTRSSPRTPTTPLITNTLLTTSTPSTSSPKPDMLPAPNSDSTKSLTISVTAEDSSKLETKADTVSDLLAARALIERKRLEQKEKRQREKEKLRAAKELLANNSTNPETSVNSPK